MQKMLSIFITLLICGSCAKQELLIDYKTKNSNILYAGIGHSIHLNSNQKDTITCRVENGTIEHIDSSLYFIFPDTNTRKLQLHIQSGKTEKHIEFRVKSIPNIQGYVNFSNLRSTSDTVSATTFQSFKYVAARVLDFDYNLKLKIKSYQITLKRKDGTVKKQQIHSNQKHIARFLAKVAQPGDVYLIDQIILELTSYKGDQTSHYSFHKQLEPMLFLIQ